MAAISGRTTKSEVAATLTLTVPFADGTMDCASDCTHTKVKLATTAAGIIVATDNVLNGYYIQITGGTGKGQTTMCNTYRATNFECDVDHLSIIPDGTSTFRIGPRVEPGEATTLVIPAAEALTYRFLVDGCVGYNYGLDASSAEATSAGRSPAAASDSASPPRPSSA